MSDFRYVIDNRGSNKVADLLQNWIQPKTLCSIATAYFTVSGFDLIADRLESCKRVRLLLGTEPGADPLRMAIHDIWRNIDIRGSSRQAERAVQFFSQDNVEVRLHAGPFFHGKSYILNHPEPVFEEDSHGSDSIGDITNINKTTRNSALPSNLIFKGKLSHSSTKPAALVGSSNFTYGGLWSNSELNLFDPKGESVIELLTWFEERWRLSKDVKEDFIKLLQGYYKPFDPFWIYAKALYELYKEDLEGPEVGKPGSTIELADFQVAGYKTAMRIIQQLGGVLIADAPGLGKTYIAGKVLEEFAYYKREPALIICPAEVEQIWRKFTAQNNIPVGALLHTEVLGRGVRNNSPEVPPANYKDYSFILVDESHHFRNPDAGRYIWLQQLLALPKPEIKVEGKTVQLDRKIVFVTATPVNNSVWDLYWQLMLLFGTSLDDIAARQGILDVRKYFDTAETGEGNIYDLIEMVTVRRSRTFIKEYYPNATLEGRRIHFPDREIVNLSYSLHTSLSDLYSVATQTIDICRLTPYRLESYRVRSRDEAKVLRGDLLSNLFRILLLKRLESSLWAFRATVQNIIDLFKVTLEYLNKGLLMPPDIVRDYLKKLEGSSEDDASIKLLIEGDSLLIEDFDVDAIKQDLEFDLRVLNEFLKILPADHNSTAAVDNKFKEFKSEISRKQQKIIVFTSFVDTANYLFSNMQEPGHVLALVTSDESKIWDGSKEIGTNRTNIINLFSPKSNNYAIQGENEIDIVISTDVLSEAINLQDASAVMNYDFPWNPMKIVQRTGRIDRIGSLHDSIIIYNIFPEEGLNNLLGLMERLLDKIAQTHRSVGLEVSLMGEEPVPRDFAVVLEKVKAGDKRILIDIEKKMEGLVGLDPQEQLLAILQTLSKDEIERIPDGAGSLTKLQAENRRNRRTGVFVAYRKRLPDGGVDRIWRFYPDDKLTSISNKTEIIPQIQFPMSYPAERRFDEESLERLRKARLVIEEEIISAQAKQRTTRIAGPIRKAFDLVQRKGRADLDKFLQSSWYKPAVERKIHVIDFKDEDDALLRLEELQKTFGTQTSETTATPLQNEKRINERETDTELAPLPENYDPSLELVCWMHII